MESDQWTIFAHNLDVFLFVWARIYSRTKHKQHKNLYFERDDIKPLFFRSRHFCHRDQQLLLIRISSLIVFLMSEETLRNKPICVDGDNWMDEWRYLKGWGDVYRDVWRYLTGWVEMSDEMSEQYIDPCLCLQSLWVSGSLNGVRSVNDLCAQPWRFPLRLSSHLFENQT